MMDEFYENIVSTLIILLDKNKILLGFKKRGFGEGKWNGFGGKVEPGEDIKACAERELEEECGLKCNDLCELGVLTFAFLDNQQRYVVHLFASTNFHGTLGESDEMRPKWFDIEDIPFDNMWPDDRYWLPHAIARKKFNAFFLYDGQEKIVKYEIEDLSLRSDNGSDL